MVLRQPYRRSDAVTLPTAAPPPPSRLGQSAPRYHLPRRQRHLRPDG